MASLASLSAAFRSVHTRHLCRHERGHPPVQQTASQCFPLLVCRRAARAVGASPRDAAGGLGTLRGGGCCAGGRGAVGAVRSLVGRLYKASS